MITPEAIEITTVILLGAFVAVKLVDIVSGWLEKWLMKE